MIVEDRLSEGNLYLLRFQRLGVVAVMAGTIMGNIVLLGFVGWGIWELSARIEPDWLYEIALWSGRLVGGPGAP